jgi:hypothetical protein
VSARERERLIARIRQIRRVAAQAAERGRSTTSAADHNELQALEDRITHLEQLVQGLQDSVDRESLRHGKRITELEARIQPEALSKALSEHARKRGL